MKKLKYYIPILSLFLSCFLFNSVQASSSFPNALPKVQKKMKESKSSKKSIRIFFKKIKKQLRKTTQQKKKQNRKFSKDTTKNRYGRIALSAFILCIISLLSIYFIYGFGLLFAIIFNIISFAAAMLGVNGKDENSNLADIIFTIHLALYAFVVLLIGWAFFINFF